MTALQFIRDGGTIPQAIKAGYTPDAIILAAQAVAKVQPFRFPQFADETEVAAAMMATAPRKYEAEDESPDAPRGKHPNSTMPEKVEAAREYAKRVGRLTQAGLRAEISIGESRARAILNGLVEEGLLAKAGGNRNDPLEYRLAHLKPRAKPAKPPRPSVSTGKNFPVDVTDAKIIAAVRRGLHTSAEVHVVVGLTRTYCQRRMRIMAEDGRLLTGERTRRDVPCEYTAPDATRRPKSVGFAATVGQRAQRASMGENVGAHGCQNWVQE